MFRRLLEIVFGVDRSGLQKGLDKAKADVTKFKQSTASDLKKAFAPITRTLSVVGAVAALQRVAKGSMEYASKFRDFSANIGVSTEWMQAWIYATTQAGSTQEAAMMGMQRFMRRLGEARAGTGELVKVLDTYGIALTDANGNQRDAMDIFRDYADAIRYARDEQEQLMLTMKGMDSEGVRNLAFLKGGSDALGQMEQAARNAGQILEDELVQKLADAQSKLDALGNRFTIFSGKLAGILLPDDTPENRALMRAQNEFFALSGADLISAKKSGPDIDWVLNRQKEILAEQEAAKAVASRREEEEQLRREEQAAAVDARRLAAQKTQLIEDMAAVEAKIAEEQEARRWKAMSDEEKLIELRRRHLNLKYEAIALGGIDGAQKQLEAEKLLSTIQDLETSTSGRAKKASARGDGLPDYAVSSLARIGGGGNIGPSASGQDRLLTETQKQTQYLRYIHEQLRRSPNPPPVLMR